MITVGQADAVKVLCVGYATVCFYAYASRLVRAVSADDALSSGDVEVPVLTTGQQETESSREGACKGI